MKRLNTLAPKLAYLRSAVLLIPTIVFAQPDSSCHSLNPAATANFDFTAALSRWGSDNSYLADRGQHKVGHIRINSLPIFNTANPREDHWLYQLANRLHITTQPHVITEQLLFQEGEPISEALMAESERILRRRAYIGDARIRVLQACDDSVDVEVVTHEVWTLVPDIRFKTTGGHSSIGFGLRDANILGTGQLFGVLYKEDQARSEFGFNYQNPNINGSHQRLTTNMSRNSDGHRYLLEAGKPFYSIRDRNGWDSQLESVAETLTQYRLGNAVSELLAKRESAAFSFSYAPDIAGDFINRFSAGLQYSQQTLSVNSGFTPSASSTPTPSTGTDFRPHLKLLYPFVQYELLEDEWRRGYNISLIQRTEDLYLGRHLLTSIGYATHDDSQLILKGSYSDTLYYRAKVLLQLHADWEGRWLQAANAWEDGLVALKLDYHHGQSNNRTLFFALELNKAYHLRNGHQLELGGDNGLRGYDSHFLQGTSFIRFTAEQRLFTERHFLALFRVGVALYYDASRIVGSTTALPNSTFQDIGIGLRLAPSRSQSGQIIHLDLAYPLDSAVPNGKRELQFIAEVKKSF
jgi:hypothetical protein